MIIAHVHTGHSTMRALILSFLLVPCLGMAGTWSHEPFGNDQSLDWAAEALTPGAGYAPLEQAFDAVLAVGSGYLEASPATEAVAAAEVLAKAFGAGTQRDAYTDDIEAWVALLPQKPSAALRAKAVEALRRVLAGDSELNELWQEGDGSDWRRNVETLIAQVK